MKRVVVITGGAGGIGQACVNLFAKEDIVVVLDVNQANVRQWSQVDNIYSYEVDLSDIDGIKRIVEKIIERFKRIDVLVQAAGIMHSQSALDVLPQTFEKIMKVNVEGMFFIMQETVKQSMKRNGGVILNFASQAAIRGFDGVMASVHYSASKGAVIAMSRQLAVEWGKYQIRVNSISPGGVLTPAMASLDFNEDLSKIPLNKLSKPEDIASVVYFLCSNHSKMITGQNIVIDGGSGIVG